MTGEGIERSEVAWVAAALGADHGAAAAWVAAQGGLKALLAAEASAWACAPGVGPATARRLHAAVQLGAQAARLVRPEGTVIDGPAAAAAQLGPPVQGLHHEELHALYLDRRRRLLAHRRLTVGSDRYTVVDPPQVFRPAVALGAAAVVLGHNHPSGDPTPSPQDREVTRRVAEAGRVLGIELVDHLVLAEGAWVSLAARGELGPWRPVAAAWTA